MPHRDRELRKPLLNGETRLRNETVTDDPDDKRTWSEEQRWDGAKVSEVEDIYRNAGVTKRSKMRRYFKRTRNIKKLARVRRIEREG
jgi:hypothetical protein